MRAATLFASGFIQVALITVQTSMVIRGSIVGVFIVGFAISLVWSLNVAAIAFGSGTDRLIYATGAGVGAVVGMLAGRGRRRG